jgi:CHAD domain-containing protein
MPLSFVPHALLQPRVSAMAEHLPHALGGSVEAVHRARVASRRLREALPIVGEAAGHRRLQEAVRQVRRVTRAFGPVRELDVTLQLLDDLAATRPPLAPAARLVRRLVRAQRERRRAVMLTTLDASQVARTRKAVEKVASRLARRPDGGAWRRVLVSRARGRADDLIDTIENAGLLFDPVRLHEVRIAAKKLRYALELAGEARLASTARMVATLKGSQAQLGRLHDLQVLLVFARAPEINAMSRYRKPLAALRDHIERECHREHARYLRRRVGLRGVCERVPDLFSKARAPGVPPAGDADAAARRRTSPPEVHHG